MAHLQLTRKTRMSSFRRIAIGTWRTTYDPQVYGAMRLPMEEVLRYRDAFREATGRHLTITHMMAMAVAAVLREMPDANAVLRFDQIYLREEIGVFFQVAMVDDETGQIDLSGAVVRDADRKGLLAVVDEFQETVDKVRSKKDEQLEGTRSLFQKIPLMLIHTVLNLVSTLLYTLNLDMRWAGLPRDPFGSVMVTNIGSLGLEEAYVPLVPYSRVPLLLATGAVERTPVEDEHGGVRFESTMKVFATFDHRILDGSHAATMSKVLRAWFKDPWSHFGPIPEDVSPAPSTP